MNSGAAKTPGGGHDGFGASLSAEVPAVPDHTLLRRIGRGSYGEVWLARNVIGTWRAVKIVHRATFERAEHFEREFKGIQKFEPISRSHEGFVDVLQIGRNHEAGYFYYVMELADSVISNQCSVISKSAKDAATGSLNTDLLITEYSPKTLRAEQQRHTRLPVSNCVDIGVTLASALAHLHKHGLVHRDIKPSNIIFVGGVPKLADIGLVAEASEARSFVGTVGFIPPEGPGSPQADLYSLGKVLYEISTGQDRQDFPQLPADLLREDCGAPFPGHPRPSDGRGAGGAGIGSGKGRSEGNSDTAPIIELNEVLLRACHKDVRQRYHSADAMRAELELLRRGQSVQRKHAAERRWTLVKRMSLAAAAMVALIAVWPYVKLGKPQRNSAPPAELTFLAVLPFDNESADSSDEFLGQSIAEEISITLRKIPQLRVKGQSTAASLKQSQDRAESARQIGVGSVLEGRVRKAENRIRLTVQLVNTRNGDQLWSEVYDGETTDIFGIQTELAQRVAGALGVPLTDSLRARLALKSTKNFAAFQAYLEGRLLVSTRERENLRKAADSFKNAIALDTNYARAYAGLADCYNLFAEHGVASALESEPKALEALRQALELDSNLAEAHAALGLYRKQFEWDWRGAEQEFKRAIELDPDYPWARQWYSILLMLTDRQEESLFQIRKGIELDPLAPNLFLNLGIRLRAAGREKEAIEQHRRTLERFPNFIPVYRHLLSAYWAAGRHDDAIALWERNETLARSTPERIGVLRTTFAETGQGSYWQISLDDYLRMSQGHYYSPVSIAHCYAQLDQKEKALDWLEKAVEERHPVAPSIRFGGSFESLRGEPRFKALLKRMGLDK